MTGADEPVASDDEPPQSVRYGMDILGSAGAVVLVGVLVLTVSGIWPPLVAIESGSMEPQMERGDMVFVMAEERFPGPGARDGVVTAATAESSGYTRFGRPGDVIAFAPNGSDQRTPIIHRAMFYVEEDEKWYSRADPESIGDADNCEELANCPAPHAGFITKGDANGRYDQVQPTKSTVVRPRWVIGTAEVRVPGLGLVRLSAR
ncbi:MULTISPECIES: S26 family signal peptidase [Haloarcula]|uniref:S26 family signal peptidase n=1 Tax=Haloarcula TaxID=2237 RepID=UPI0023E82183|nr:S26 family signal peptidase [Halomicroarcula sp. SHR3]